MPILPPFFRRRLDQTNRLIERVNRANLGMIAASVAFFGFLAIFPAVAAVIAIWGFAADTSIIRSQLDVLREILPADAFRILQQQVEALLAANSSGLGWATVLSTLFAIWSARAGVAALVSGINAIHHLPERGGLQHQIVALLLTVTLVCITLTALVASIVVPVGIEFVNLGSVTAIVLEAANTLLGMALVTLALALAYRFGPNVPLRQHRRFFTRGIFVAMVLWVIVSRGFVIYLANFNSYNKVYGSIGAVVVLLMWLYLSAYAVLIGAAVDADRASRELK